MAKCIICNSEAHVDDSNIHELKIACSACGKFRITDVALSVIPRDLYPNWRSKLQEWIRFNQDASHVLITEARIKSIF